MSRVNVHSTNQILNGNEKIFITRFHFYVSTIIISLNLFQMSQKNNYLRLTKIVALIKMFEQPRIGNDKHYLYVRTLLFSCYLTTNNHMST
jgi:hypothetical protein